jgi:hypothetical protein
LFLLCGLSRISDVLVSSLTEKSVGKARIKELRSPYLLPTALALLVAIGIVFYLVSPFLLLRSLSYAVKNGDRATIADDVDFPAVRNGLKQQLDDYLKSRAARPHKRNPFSNLLLSLAPSIGGQVIDAIVTPDGVAQIVRQHVNQGASGTSRPSLWQGSFSWTGPNSLLATYVDGRHKDRPFALELRSKGLFDWQVTGLILPIKELAGT